MLFAEAVVESRSGVGGLAVEASEKPDVFERTWRLLLQAVLVYLVLQGLVSLIFYEYKLVLLVKDAMLGVAYLAFGAWLWRSRPRPHVPKLLAIPLLAFVIIATLQAFNTALDDPLVALVGIKTRLFYVPLIVMGYFFLKQTRHLEALALLIAIPSIPVNLIAFLQYLLGPERVAALGTGFAASIWQIGMVEGSPVYRPIATFSSSGHYASYLLIATLVTAAICLSSDVPSHRLHLYRLALGLQFAGLAVDGGRAALILAPLSVVIVSAQALTFRGGSRRPVGTAELLNLGLLVLGLSVGWLIAPTASYRIESVLAPSVDEYQLNVFDVVRVSGERIGTLSGDDLGVGHGLGTASPGSRYVTAASRITSTGVFEGLAGQLIWEMGLPGLLSFVLSWLALIVLGIRAYRRPNHPELRPMAAAIVVFNSVLLVTFGTYAPLAYAPTSVVFWVLNGVLLSLGHLDSRRDSHDLPKVPAPAS